MDKKEYEEVNEIVCPLPGCGHAWCKLCSQALEIGGPKHSCDGSSELNHLMSQRGWKHCPGQSSRRRGAVRGSILTAFCPCTPTGCQTPAEKIEGCNHMTCMSPGCNAYVGITLDWIRAHECSVQALLLFVWTAYRAVSAQERDTVAGVQALQQMHALLNRISIPFGSALSMHVVRLERIL